MTEERKKQAESPMAACMEMMGGRPRGASEMPMCPMAVTFQRMMGKARYGLFLALPGTALIVGGVLILIEPKILLWLMAGTSILLGIVVLMIATFIRRLASQFRSAHGTS